MEALKRRLARFIKSYEAKFAEQEGVIRRLEQDKVALQGQVKDLSSRVMLETQFIIDQDEEEE